VIPGAAATVQAATTFGLASAVGVATTFARGDHTHGSVARELPAAGTVGQYLAKNTATDFDVGWLTNPHARVRRSTTQSIPNAAATAMTFDTQDTNVGALWAAGNPTRLTAPRTGFYAIGVYASWAANATGVRTIQLRSNGSVDNATDGRLNFGGTYGINQTMATMMQLNANDYMEMMMFQDSGAALNVSVNCVFWMTYLSP